MRSLVWIMAAVFALGGCAAGGAHRAPLRPLASEPASVPIMMDPLTGEASLALRVMTWNVAGLPTPLKTGRAAALRRIGDALAELRAEGEAPHIVLLQEGFMDGPMADLIARSGYAFVARGPAANEAPPRGSAGLDGGLPLRGESLGKMFGAGLYILSDFPILETQTAAFRACAGFDCLANKGVMLARIDLPGAPGPVAILNTHMNAKRASRAPRGRAHRAHRMQIDAIERFTAETAAPDEPLIFGGDFNMQDSPERWSYAAPGGMSALARAWCGADAACDAAALTPTELSDEITQDLQGFHDGEEIHVRPVRLAILHDKYGPEALSDHSAYLVEYRLSWRTGQDGASMIAEWEASRRDAGLFFGLLDSATRTAELETASAE